MPGAVCQAFIDFYRTLRVGGDCPHQRVFDVLDVMDLRADVIPHLWTLTVFQAPRRFQYGVLGGAIVEAGPRARSGHFLDEVQPEEAERVQILHDAVDGRDLVYRRGKPLFSYREKVDELESVVAPFVDDGGAVSKLICCTVYYWQDGYFDPDVERNAVGLGV